MDFSLSEDQQAIADLSRRIFTDGATHERMRELERGSGPRFDRDLWVVVAEAGLTGIAVPESYGGSGLGFVEVSAIAEQLGRTAAPLPLLETIVLGALPIAEFGSDDQKRALLPAVVEGELVLTAALQEDGDDLSAPGRPSTTASPDGDGWRLDGAKICVPNGMVANRILVPASLADGRVGVFIVDVAADGVERIELDTTNGQPDANLELSGVRVGTADLLGDLESGPSITAWIELRATAALGALAVGVCDQALQLTSEYVKTRKQFDQPIAMFQAVGHRAADAYVDTEAIRLTALQACWRIAADMPAEKEVAIAKFWAAEGGQRVVHAAQHLHGGVGVDRDYPLHRFFLYAKHLELSLGGATPQLLRIGRILAEAAE